MDKFLYFTSTDKVLTTIDCWAIWAMWWWNNDMCDSIYTIVSKWQNYSDGEQVSGWQALGIVRGRSEFTPEWV